MAEEDKDLQSDISSLTADLSKEFVQDEDSRERAKALVPYDPLQRYLAEIRRFRCILFYCRTTKSEFRCSTGY